MMKSKANYFKLFCCKVFFVVNILVVNIVLMLISLLWLLFVWVLEWSTKKFPTLLNGLVVALLVVADPIIFVCGQQMFIQVTIVVFVVVTMVDQYRQGVSKKTQH